MSAPDHAGGSEVPKRIEEIESPTVQFNDGSNEKYDTLETLTGDWFRGLNPEEDNSEVHFIPSEPVKWISDGTGDNGD